MISKQISYFRDKEDIHLRPSNKVFKNIILITGISGSGKSTLANKMKNNLDCHKVSFDLVFFHEHDTITEFEKKIIEKFKKRYLEWEKNLFLGYSTLNGKVFEKYSNLFFEFILEESTKEEKIIILEGSHIFKYILPEKVKINELIILRPSFFKSMIRKMKRQHKRAILEFKLKKITLKTFVSKELSNIKNSTINLYKWYKKINEFIKVICY